MESYYTAAAYRKEKVTQIYLFCFKNKHDFSLVICVCMSSMSLLDIIVRGLSVKRIAGSDGKGGAVWPLYKS